MVTRTIPKCPFCGAVTAKPIYKEGGKTFIGDNFVRWEPLPHNCNQRQEFLDNALADMDIVTPFIPNKTSKLKVYGGKWPAVSKTTIKNKIIQGFAEGKWEITHDFRGTTWTEALTPLFEYLKKQGITIS